jgi:hypothetical protein
MTMNSEEEKLISDELSYSYETFSEECRGFFSDGFLKISRKNLHEFAK